MSTIRDLSIRRLGMAVGLASVLLPASAGLVQAGFLDALFGQPRARVYAPPPGYDFGYEHGGGDPYGQERPRQRAVKRAPPKEAPPVLQEALCCKTGGDPMKAIMMDDTLVAGDVVMTPEGLRTFTGSAVPHRPDDFVDITRSRLVSKSQRRQLLALDR